MGLVAAVGDKLVGERTTRSEITVEATQSLCLIAGGNNMEPAIRIDAHQQSISWLQV